MDVRKLRNTGLRRNALVRELAEVTEELYPLVCQAYRGGMSVTRIAREARISRVAVYDILRRHGVPIREEQR